MQEHTDNFHISPLPENIGIGITSLTQLPESLVREYDYVVNGRYHNYFFTQDNFTWPTVPRFTCPVFDGFSPNLNKELHVGHLKNLCVAAAIAKITKASPVAMLRISNGQIPGALDKFNKWCELAGYHPTLYFDTRLPPPTVPLTEGTGEYVGCKMKGDVVIYKSDGTPTYACHELSFAETVSPDLYLTEAEQAKHFASLGLSNKHIPMGLVLGEDNKKMRSTDKLSGEEYNALTAQDLFDSILAGLSPTTEPASLAWNVLAWQFNSTAVNTNTVCDVDNWVKLTSPGIYITYTAAKISQAISNAHNASKMSLPSVDMIPLMGYSNYFSYYLQMAITHNEPHHLAHFALKLAYKLSDIYSNIYIKTAPPELLTSLQYGLDTLKQTMGLLGMRFLIEV